jgi:carbonic anhydrase
MKKLVTGFQRFRDHALSEHRDLFERLSAGQAPHSLFITCSDSRIDPSLLVQSKPGDLFVLRNAGNLIPPWTSGPASSEAATIEFAIEGLGVEDIVVCGHSQCGAVKALIAEEPPRGMPALSSWLEQAEATRRLVRSGYADRDPDEQLNVAVQENVLCQIATLRTHPAVAARLATGRVRLHAWVFKIATAEIFSYDVADGQFRPLGEGTIRPLEARSHAEPVFVRREQPGS